MKETIAMYYEDAFKRKIIARVVQTVNTERGPAVVTDQTIFYPEGGGQPGDRGTIGTAQIIDTFEDSEGRILHLIDAQKPFETGDEILMELDWSHRYDYMQQHSAQHLISGILHSLANIGTISVHLGHETLSIETDTDEITQQQLLEVEDKVNEIIRMHVPVTVEELPFDQAQAIGLRRSIKVDGLVRLVRIGDYDLIACGGLHVQNSSDIIQVILVGTERIRGHIRTHWIAGKRAVNKIREDLRIINELGTIFSAQSHELITKALNLQTSATDALYHLQKTQALLVSRDLEARLEGAPKIMHCPIVVFEAPTENLNYLKLLAEALIPVSEIVLCAIQERSDDSIAWIISVKGEISAKLPFNVIREKLFPLIAAKGGGKPPLWQGIGMNMAGKQQFLKEFLRLVEQGATGVSTG
jgi:alanyl-tRNA synthetase